MTPLETITHLGVEMCAVSVFDIPPGTQDKGCGVCEGHRTRMGLCDVLNCGEEERPDRTEVVFISADRLALARLRGGKL
jgi:hypothetical protein